MRKVLLALLVVSLFASMAIADEISHDVSMKVIKSDTAGNPVEFITHDGLHVIYMGTFRSMEIPKTETEESQDTAAEEKISDNIVSVFMVNSEKDTLLTTDITNGVDTKINEFRYRDGEWCHIAGQSRKSAEILEDIWMRVEFFHVLPLAKFAELPRIGRFGFTFNGTQNGNAPTELIYRKIRVQPYSAWKEIEKQVISMEDGEWEEEVSQDIKPIG